MTVLGDVLEFVGVPERISAPSKERFVTVRLNCGGAVERIIGSGKTPVAFTGYRVRPGQFIYSRIDARNGAFAIVGKELDGAVVSKDFPVFRIDHDRVDPSYLNHFFRSGRLEKLILSRSRGATNRQRIKEHELLGFPIPLPPLDEQRRIAAILDHAAAVRDLRLETILKLRDIKHVLTGYLSKSDWPSMPLGSVATTSSGGTPDRSKSEYYGGEIPWVKSGELHSGIVKMTEESITEAGLNGSSAKLLPTGTVLIAMYGATAGVVSQLGIPATTNQAICAVTPGPQLNATYLIETLRHQTARLSSLRSGGAQPNLSQKTLRSLQIPIPPLEEQLNFAHRIEQISTSIERIERSLHAIESLIDSLQTRAFRGEL